MAQNNPNNTRPMVEEDDDEYDSDDDDDRSLPRDTTTTHEAAVAAAEVEAMDGTGRTNNNAQRAQAAVMGVNPTDDADDVQGFAVTDESGRLVQQRFYTFLSTLYVTRMMRMFTYVFVVLFGRFFAPFRAILFVHCCRSNVLVALPFLYPYSCTTVRTNFVPKTRMHQNSSELVEMDRAEQDDEDNNINNGNEPDPQRHHRRPVATLYPYAEQAAAMSHRQLHRKNTTTNNNTANDDDDPEAAAAAPVSIFSSTLLLDFAHVLADDYELAEAILSDFCRLEPYLREAVYSFVTELHPELIEAEEETRTSSSTFVRTIYFVAVHNLPTVHPVRALRTNAIGQLTSVCGTVTRTSEVRPELLMGTFTCMKCGLVASQIPQQFHYTRPVTCRNPRCGNTSSAQFVLDVRRSSLADWQRLRVQENSDAIPPGGMPRTLDVYVRHEMVERAKAGDRCILTGSWVVIPDGSALARAGDAAKRIRRPLESTAAAGGGGGGVRGLKALGVQELTYRTAFVACCILPAESVARVSQQRSSSSLSAATTTNEAHGRGSQAMAALLFGNQLATNSPDLSAEEVVLEFTRSERDRIREMRNHPHLYERLAESIAPTTFGHLEIKKGILLMLLGGVHKTTYDRVRLRGDINVCVVGDPSTAKSQFLKYVHSFMPARCVYTSGKASSAAGLTAAVQRDHDTGEYCIEAGALMLADNGICCSKFYSWHSVVLLWYALLSFLTFLLFRSRFLLL